MEALLLESPDNPSSLVSIPEDQWFERKSGRVSGKDLAIALSALANAEGGVVVVGVHGGSVEGVEPRRANDLRQASIDFVAPPVRVRCRDLTIDGGSGARSVMLFSVEPGEQVHEMTNGDVYLRVGDESRRLNFAQRQELHFDRGSSHYDGQSAQVPLDDVATDTARTYADTIGSASVEAMLNARSLLTRSGDPTVGAYLLFAQHPQTLMPQALVRVLKYTERERGTGATQSLDDDGDTRLEGSIPAVIDQAAALVDKLVPKRRALAASGLFEAVPIVPRDAWLEGLVNAVIHRSYSLSGDHIRVEVFPDRIEIESPGRFPGLANPERPMDISRFARNPRIARVCADLRISQELGEGIKRIYASMRTSGLTDPVYRQSAGSVRLVLQSAHAVPQAIRDRLTPGALTTLDALRAAGRPLGTGDIGSLRGISRPSAIRHLNSLRDVGLVEWEGTSPQDPRAVWRVLSSTRPAGS